MGNTRVAWSKDVSTRYEIKNVRFIGDFRPNVSIVNATKAKLPLKSNGLGSKPNSGKECRQDSQH